MQPISVETRTAAWVDQGALLVFAIAVIARVLLAIYTYDAPPIEDMQRYYAVGEQVLAGGSGYDLEPVYYPYPPLWMLVEAAAVRVATICGIAFDFVIKLPVMFADAALAALIFAALRERTALRAAFGWSMVYALNPLAIMVSAGHGQFDALAVLGMVLAWLWLPRHPRRSALALGMAIALKLYPAVLIPALLLRLDGENRRALIPPWLVLVSAPLAITVLPFLVRGEFTVLLRPLQYGLIGSTGLGILTLLSDLGLPIHGITPGVGDLPGLAGMILSRGRLSVVFRGALALVLTALFARSWRTPARIAALPVALFLCIYLFSGLTTQYLIWVLPFALLRRDRFALLYTVGASLLAGASYAASSAVCPVRNSSGADGRSGDNCAAERDVLRPRAKLGGLAADQCLSTAESTD